ncbi:hypothetical protein NQ006_03000 [Pediococcus pentosaceus]|nr:hypothetical protein [Pediococcus pentosaceus]MCQ9315760.1 hypothetical protein [Pediococcus pentosaceus]
MNEGTKKARIIFGRITDFDNIQVLFCISILTKMEEFNQWN